MGHRHRHVVPALVACLALSHAAPASARVHCTSRPQGAVGYAVRATGAHQLPLPAATPPIAILDSGVSEVPELAGRILRGFDARTGGSSIVDGDGHGTAVATVAAGQAGAVRGVSPTSTIIPIKVFDATGYAQPRWVVRAIKRALALGARVINFSAAIDRTRSTPAIDHAAQQAIFAAVTRGVPVVTPSGNESSGRLDVPAAYPHVLAVGASDERGRRAWFSNGGRGLDLVAPGSAIATAAPRALCPSGYSLVSGTSFASPAVAGAAALLLARYPGLDVAQLTEMLRSGADRRGGPVWNPGTGFGLLDVPAALNAPIPAPDAPEVDDTIRWAKKHPVVLDLGRRTTRIAARVTTRWDPADVFRVRVKRGDRLQAVITADTGDLTLAIAGAAKTRARAKLSRVSFRALRSGVAYVRVGAAATPPAGVPYELRLTRR